jgi:proteic killer suppression protein
LRYYLKVIKSFADHETENLFKRQRSRKFAPDIQRKARMKLEILDAAGSLQDLTIPPRNKLEKLSGDRSGQYRIRINQQWRVFFFWQGTDAYEVEIVD